MSDGEARPLGAMGSDLGTADLGRGPAIVEAALVLIGGLVVWFPVETSPLTGLGLAMGCCGLGLWACRQTAASSMARASVVICSLLLMLGLSAVSGWDVESGLRQIGLAFSVALLIWIASRRRPGRVAVLGLCLAVAGLSAWAIWQVAFGFERALALAPEIPEAMLEAYVYRLQTGRAFASLTVPGHLAVLLATVLPVLVSRIGKTWSGAAALLGVLLCLVGLGLTRSPIGAGLAVAAVAAVVLARQRRWMLVVLVALAVVLTGTLLLRTDLGALEPVRLRLENWSTALWVFSGSPISGAGLGGFGQASLAVPFDVGNRPVHAHSVLFEVLADIGLAGLVLAACLGLWLVRLARRVWPLEPALAVAIMVIPVHNLLDFSCYSTGVMAPWAVLVGWAFALQRRQCDSFATITSIRAPLAVCLIVVTAAGLHASSRMVERAVLEAEGAAPAERWQRALLAGRLAPWRVRPAELAAVAALELGAAACNQARGPLDRALWLRPGSAALHSLAGRLALCQGSLGGAVGQSWAASHLSGGSGRLGEEWSQLVSELEAATSTASDADSSGPSRQRHGR